MPRLDVNGIGLHYEERGGGPPLLMIMGYGTSAALWGDAYLDRLARSFRVIAPDNRGTGGSEKRDEPVEIGTLADDAAALLAALGIESAHVYGVSMGGMIAQELALAYPTLVDRLVLYGTFARPRSAVMDPWLNFVAQATERLDATAATLAWLPWLYTPAFLARPEQVEAALAWQEPYPAPAHGIAAQTEAVRHHDTLERLCRIAARTLVLVGADDIVTPVYYSQELAERIPGARLQVLERGGHSAIWEDPETGAEALLAFLAA